MAFQFPDGLAPEVYPLAWLLGRWRGPGFLAYPGIPQRPVLVEVHFDHDGGPYLSYSATTSILDSPLESLEEKVDLDSLRTGPVWSAESGYWRVRPDGDGAASADASGAPGGAAAATGTTTTGTTANGTTTAGHDAGAGAAGHPPPTALEVLLAEPSGHVSVYVGQVQGPRVELSTDLIARTATGAQIAAASRMYGLVGGELMWATDLAAFGHELQSYSSGRLQRIE